jgi:hypothetical protein
MKSSNNKFRDSLKILLSIIAIISSTLLVNFATASSALAHAEIRTISPEDAASLSLSPKNITLIFNETVSGKDGSVQLLSSDGKIILRSGKIFSDTIILSTAKLKPGRYVIRWAVTSADGHPISGATSFALNTKTSNTQSKTIILKNTISNQKSIVIINGERAGERKVEIQGTQGEGTIEFRNTIYGAPFIWKLSVINGRLSGSGMLPGSGRYDITLRIRTGLFDEEVSTGSIIIKK